MSQDTRKDKRAKVVSLNVRYKSATVDEFIENHSHDVSKGGLFVKTPTPFPPGTLLKFEIRLAGDKSVISGVGRVVWKREPTQAGAEKPAGMGVKFIKIDDSSRAIIDRLITQKADAGSAYTSEQPVDEPVPPAHPSTLRGLVAAAPVEPNAAPGPSPVNVPAPTGSGATKLPVPPPAAPAAVPPPAPPAKPNLTGTLAGPLPGGPLRSTGVPNVPGAAPVPAAATSSKPGLGGAKPPPRPAGAAPAPTAGKAAATVMGVAPPPAAAVPAEKISEPKLAPPAPGAPPPRPVAPARKATMMGMGIASSPPPPGEVGPLPSPTPPPAVGTSAPPKAAEPMFPAMDPESGREPVGEQTVMKQAAELLEEALKEAGGSMDEIGQNPLFAKQGESPVELSPPSSRKQSGDTMIMTSPTAGAEPSPVSAPGVSAVAAARPQSSPSQPPAKSEPRRLGDDLGPTEKKKGGSAGVLVALLFVLLLVGGGVYAWQTGLLAGVIGPAPVPPSASNSPPIPPSSPPSASSAPVMALPTTEGGAEATDASAASAMTDAGAAMATDAAAASTDAGPESKLDAGKVPPPTTAVAPPPPKPPPPRPRPPPPRPPVTPPTGETPPETPPTPPPPPPPAPTKDPANEL